MIGLATTITHGLLICVPFTMFVLVTFWSRPRLWLHSLPADIRQRAGPKTAAEVRWTNRVLLPVFLLILPGLSIVSTVAAAPPFPDGLSPAGALRHLYGLWIIVHAWDLAAIDLPHVLMIDPHRPPIAGTEGAKGWNDPGFHVRSFGKAVLMSGIFVVPAALLLALVL